MEELMHARASKTDPHLWFERLCIFSEPTEEHVIRTVPFHRGLNLVWAKEPVSGSAVGTRAAGHGVGKSSLCLLLRFCLGETSKAVAELREELRQEFPKGGVAAVLHVEGQPFTYCRFFNANKDGWAVAGTEVSSLWEESGNLTDRAFLQQLAETMTKGLSTPVIPETGQTIEWRHVQAWISRDQGSRFKSFFDWREGEGTGLHRSRQDPPVVLRAVLGLLQRDESALLNRIAQQEQSLTMARKHTEELEQAPALVRRRIESNLRAWAKATDDLPLRSDDLFADSVEQKLKVLQQEADGKLEKQDAQLDAVGRQISDVWQEIKNLSSQQKVAEAQYQLADAARLQNEADYRAAAGKLLTLKTLGDWCEHGNVEFQQCEHIKAQILRLDASTDLRSAADNKNLQNAMTVAASNTVGALERKKKLEAAMLLLRNQEKALLDERRKLRMARDTQAIEADRGKVLLTELNRWEQQAGSAAAKSAIDASRQQGDNIERELNSTRTQLVVLQKERSAREKKLAACLDALVIELFPDDAHGTFDQRDESRPFKLSMHGGEAYRVLEVLLGDLACMLDSTSPDSAFPGLLIHDCPREADMSTSLYEHFLLLIHNLQSSQYAVVQPPFQYIVTTTTPPPSVLQDKTKYLALELDPSTEDGLLFKKRFLGNRQLTTAL